MIMMLGHIWVSFEVHGHEYKIKPCPGLRFSPATFNYMGKDTEEMDRKIFQGVVLLKPQRDEGQGNRRYI